MQVIRYFFILSLLFASGAQHINAAISASTKVWNRTESSKSSIDNLSKNKISEFIPYAERNQIISDSDVNFDSFLGTESEDEVEVEELINTDSKAGINNYFISHFCVSSNSVASERKKNLGYPYAFLKSTSTPRFILFQDFRI